MSRTQALSIALLCASLASAQEFRATISGRVLDSSGGAVPNAKIQATNIANNEVSDATSDASGVYSFPFLRPGQYKIVATAPGFKTYIALEVGALTESINVAADAALLETQTASRVGVVNQIQVSEMPLNSRNPFMLGSMMSGVTYRGAAIWQRPFDKARLPSGA